MLPIAHSELVQIVRNRSVLLTGLIMPVLSAAFFVYNRDTFEGIGSPGYIGAVIVFAIGGFSLYATTVTTLAARRQDLFLKRLRSTTASDSAILSGLVLPISALSVVLVGAILGVYAALSSPPADVVLLAVAIVATLAMMLAFGLATAGLTSSPEQAQVTALPLSLGTVVVASWVGITGTDSLPLLKRLLPGGAATELIMNAWDGGIPLGDALALLAPTLAWVVVAVAVAFRVFAWESRR